MESSDDDKSDSESCSDDSSNGSSFITPQEGLSAETLAALMQFSNGSSYGFDTEVSPTAGENEALVDNNDSNVNIAGPIIATRCPIEETIQRLKAKEEQVAFVPSTLLELQETYPMNAAQQLCNEGVVRLNGILPSETCDLCLDEINRILLLDLNAIDTDTQHDGGLHDVNSGFGNVFCRNNRYDMYLRDEGEFHKALCFAMARGTPLGNMFSDLFTGRPSSFHELSALISDPGSVSQPVHPDNKYISPIGPLYTCFIALQDVDTHIGPTIFLPGSNTADSHKMYENHLTKQAFLESHEYRTALLRKGDVAIMDSRTLHFGSGNSSGTITGNSDLDEDDMCEARRRVLLYFTLRNPFYSETGAEEDYPPGGSKWADVNLSTADFW